MMSSHVNRSSISEPPAATTSSAKPKVSLSSTSHLDPGAYVRGSHPITIGKDTLVHPRVHLVSIHSPLVVGDHCIISEKAVLGGPLPPSSSSSSNSNNINPDSTTNLNPQGSSSSSAPQVPATPTKISSYVHIHPHANISHSTTIKAYTIIESHVTISSGVTVGAHSKICSGVTLTQNIPSWTVVYGKGELKRKRYQPSKNGSVTKVDSSTNDENEERFSDNEIEMGRIKMMNYERTAAKTILQNAAKVASMAKKK